MRRRQALTRQQICHRCDLELHPPALREAVCVVSKPPSLWGSCYSCRQGGSRWSGRGHHRLGGGLPGPCCVRKHVDQRGWNSVKTQSDRDEDKRDVPARQTEGGGGEVWPERPAAECRTRPATCAEADCADAGAGGCAESTQSGDSLVLPAVCGAAFLLCPSRPLAAE